MTVLGFALPARTFSRRPAPERTQAGSRAPGAGRSAGPVRPGQARPFPHGSGAYSVKTWRPPVPEPLQPAPLLNPLTLAGIGALAFLSQLWGYLARSDRRGQAGGPMLPGGEFPFVTGTYSPTGLTTMLPTPGAFIGRRTQDGVCLEDNLSSVVGGTNPVSFQNGITEVRYFTGSGTSFCGGWFQLRPEIVGGDGQVYLGPQVSGGSIGWREWLGSWEFQSSAPDARPVGSLPLIPLPEARVPSGLFDLPAPTPLPLPLPKTDPLPRPLPEVEPLTQPAPALPRAVPGVGTLPRLPAYPSSSRPAAPALPGQQVQDGALVPQKPADLVKTPVQTVIPWPGAEPVGGPGQSPQPTLTGIAQEVGRIERKVDQIMRPRQLAPGQEPIDWREILEDVWEWLNRVEEGGAYELRGVCETDANGEPLETVIEHPWPPGIGESVSVVGRLDAIAAMLQTHKELRQPICRGPKAQGEPVTVQFEEM